MGFFRYSVFRY